MTLIHLISGFLYISWISTTQSYHIQIELFFWCFFLSYCIGSTPSTLNLYKETEYLELAFLFTKIIIYFKVHYPFVTVSYFHFGQFFFGISYRAGLFNKTVSLFFVLEGFFFSSQITLTLNFKV